MTAVASFDNDVIVNIQTSPGQVFQRDFGIALLGTDQVGAGFSGIRYYDSEEAAKADTDLLTESVTAIAKALSQPLHLSTIAVYELDFLVALAAQLDAAKAAGEAAGRPFYFLSISDRTEAEILEAAAWQETETGLFIPQTSDAAVLAGTAGNVGEDLAGFDYLRTAWLWHSVDAEYLGLSWTSASGAVDPDAGTTIWGQKSVTGFTQSAVTTDTELGNITTNNGNTYRPFRRRNVVNPGTLANGQFIDTLITRDWLEDRLNAGAAQLLIDKSAAGQKLAYDNDGINAVAAMVQRLLDHGVDIDHFESAAIDNIPTRASIAASNPTDIVNRILRLQITVVLAGGIQKIVFNVVVLFA